MSAQHPFRPDNVEEIVQTRLSSRVAETTAPLSDEAAATLLGEDDES